VRCLYGHNIFIINFERSEKMKQVIIPIMAVLVCGLSIFPSPAQAKYGGGAGEPNDPYLIYDANHMQAIGADANDWDKHFKLMADIDLGGIIYTTAVIAPEEDNSNWYFDGIAFTGVFDGKSHKITGLTVDDNGAGNDCLGLFGCIGEDGEVRNLGLEGGSVSGDVCVGGLVGRNYGSVSNCYSMGSVSGDTGVGGLVGLNNGGSVSNCYSKGDVNGIVEIGGLVGGNYGRVTNCYSTGDVDGRGSVGGLMGLNSGNVSNCYSTGEVDGVGSVGGLVGTNRHNNISSCYSTGDVNGAGNVGGLVGSNGDWHTPGGAISNCYSTGSVSGDTVIGGLVGGNYAGLLATAKILKCYSTGSVSGDTVIGGLVGSNEVEVSDSFWDVNTSGLDYSAGGVGKTTDQMQIRSTFTDAGWDFINVWNIGENQTYPYLRVYLPSDINKDGIVNFVDVAITTNKWMEEYFLWNRPPEVLITYPQDGDRLMVGGVPPQTMILAEANDYDGTVVRVEFFDDDLKLGEDTDGSDGWSYLWQGYSLGYHTLTAVAWDQEGLSGTSPPVNVEVWMPFPPPP
jgi:hypothetical protein